MNQQVTTDRNGVEVLSYRRCLELLGDRQIGRVAFVHAGTPVILPVNYAIAGSSIVFRSTVGNKLHAAGNHQPVAFEIDDHDPRSRTGWSVLVTGTLEVIDEPATPEHLPAVDLDSWVVTDPDAPWLRIRADSVTGRRVTTEPAEHASP